MKYNAKNDEIKEKLINISCKTKYLTQKPAKGGMPAIENKLPVKAIVKVGLKLNKVGSSEIFSMCSRVYILQTESITTKKFRTKIAQIKKYTNTAAIESKVD